MATDHSKQNEKTSGFQQPKSFSIVDDFAYGTNVASCDTYIRLGFLRKVFGILSAQLALCTVISLIFMSNDTIQNFVRENSWMMLASFILTIILLFAVHFKRHEIPINYILLIAFTIFQSYSVATVITFYTVRSVILAFGLTTTATVGLTAFALFSKRDFSSLYASLVSCLFIMIVAGMLQIFIQSSALDFMISAGGAIIFSLFIIVDINLVMNRLSPEEYILASLNLYLDIINLFLHILRLVGERK